MALMLLAGVSAWALSQRALLAQEFAEATPPVRAAEAAPGVYLPWLSGMPSPPVTPTEEPDSLLCRFGVNAPGGVSNYPVTEMRVSWYQNYTTSLNPARPQGMEFAQTIRLSQPSLTSYTFRPVASVITQTAMLNPGAIWYVGNEPDRIVFQDDIEPHLYARAYHELYTLIKEVDPTARLFAGSIVQPTPVRLTYLDMVLDAYRSEYGVSMPVDGWSVHNFILNEASCDAFPAWACWGADIPPGVDAVEGLRVDVQDNDNFDLFVEQIERFRQWMWSRGYRNTPLYLSEYGVLMPAGLFTPDFTVERVNTFMGKTFDYLLQATDDVTGYPPDGNRLVQRLSWYSTGDTQYNGRLFDPQTREFTGIGLFYREYTQAITETVDFFPVKISTDPAAPVTSGDPISMTVKAQIGNSGNGLTAQAVEVRFYDGDPEQGGAQIGETQTVTLSGCGDVAQASVLWPNLGQGAYSVYVAVQGAAGSLAEEGAALENNQLSQIFRIGTDQLFLPRVNR